MWWYRAEGIETLWCLSHRWWKHSIRTWRRQCHTTSHFQCPFPPLRALLVHQWDHVTPLLCLGYICPCSDTSTCRLLRPGCGREGTQPSLTWTTTCQRWLPPHHRPSVSSTGITSSVGMPSTGSGPFLQSSSPGNTLFYRDPRAVAGAFMTNTRQFLQLMC